MLIKVTTTGGTILLNASLIDAVTKPDEGGLEGSILWLSKKGIPDAGFDMDDELLWVEESLDEILALLAGGYR